MAQKRKPAETKKKPVVKKKPITKAEVEARFNKSGRDNKGKFAKGNHIWKERTTHGRDKAFTPETLWLGALEFFELYDNNPIEVIDYKGKDADKVILYKQRAYTWQALELFLDVDSLKRYKADYPEFGNVIARIERTMYASKFEGAAAGILNPNIIARDLGLREQTHLSVEDDRKAAGDLFPDVEDLEAGKK